MAKKKEAAETGKVLTPEEMARVSAEQAAAALDELGKGALAKAKRSPHKRG